jgi:O-antigen ligase
MLATTGTLGFIVFLFAIFIVPGLYFLKAWRRGGSRETGFFALGGLVFLWAYAVFGIAEGWMARNPFSNQFGFYLAVLAAGVAVERRRQAREVKEIEGGSAAGSG